MLRNHKNKGIMKVEMLEIVKLEIIKEEREKNYSNNEKNMKHEHRNINHNDKTVEIMGMIRVMTKLSKSTKRNDNLFTKIIIRLCYVYRQVKVKEKDY